MAKAKNEPLFEIAYTTRTGKHGRKAVAASRIPLAAIDLEERGCYDIRVSYYPLTPGVDPIL